MFHVIFAQLCVFICFVIILPKFLFIPIIKLLEKRDHIIKETKKETDLLNNQIQVISKDIETCISKAILDGKKNLTNSQEENEKFYAEELKAIDRYTKKQIIKNKKKLADEVYKLRLKLTSNEVELVDYTIKHFLNQDKSQSLNFLDC